MIFYFSGTGNSKWVAEQLAEKIGEKTADIAQLIKNNSEEYLLDENEKLGFVFPVYAWAPPQIVTDFVKKIKRNPSTYTFAVCTCGEEAGYTIEKFAKTIWLNSGFSIVMPNNYLIGFDVDQDHVRDKKILQAGKRIEEIGQSILKEKNTFEITKGKMAFVKSNIIFYFFNKFGRNTKSFYAEESCNHCGICAKQCPTENIQLVEGKPKWDQHCTMCMSCINRCPVRAIQYGSSTKKKGRYYFGMEK